MNVTMLIRRALTAVLTVLAVLAVASCNKKIEKPETGCYYDVKAAGDRYFVLFDSYDGKGTATGHFYQQLRDEAVAARQDFSARFNRKALSVTADGKEIRLKYDDISYKLYKEPEYEEKDMKIYREKYCEVTQKHEVFYGRAQGYWTSLEGAEENVGRIFTRGYVKSFRKRDLNLTLDLYSPSELDSRRPLILFIHGGAFYIGYKDEPAYIDFCKHFASMGYVTASIDYRLGFHASKNEIERAGYVALQDAHAALRFLVSHADEYHIDTDRIFVAGSSAGAITGLNLAFMRDDVRPESTMGKRTFLSHKADLGPIESSGNDIKAKFSIKAVANMWGAVSDLDLLHNSRTSIISFHGEDDKVVPYAEGYPLASVGEGLAKMLSEEMYGSACIDRKAAELGLHHSFHSFPGEGHAFNTTGKDKQPNANHVFIKNRIAEFFFDDMVKEVAKIYTEVPGSYYVDCREITDVQWKVEGGFVLDQHDSESISVLWCADRPHTLTVSGSYNHEIGWTDTIRP